jgi:hypothetical protein
MATEEDKNNSDENEMENSKFDDYKKDFKEDKEATNQIKRTFSRRRAVIRIFLGFVAMVLWFLVGVSPTIIFSSSIQEFIGVFSFFVKYPAMFLLVALLNIFLAVIVYLFIGIWWWAAFHLIWSIRWFYGYFKYRKASLVEVIKSMNK